MARKWREGENRIVTVTPVIGGVLVPISLTILAVLIVAEGSIHYGILHDIRWWLAFVVVGPMVLLTLTRLWRWRSHKIHVTTQRVIIEGGALRHWMTSIEYREILSLHQQQGIAQRLLRRGDVVVEVNSGSVHLGRVRHPSALCRIIDAQRLQEPAETPPHLDTVFDYNDDERYRVRVRPGRSSRRYSG